MFARVFACLLVRVRDCVRACLLALSLTGVVACLLACSRTCLCACLLACVVACLRGCLLGKKRARAMNPFTHSETKYLEFVWDAFCNNVVVEELCQPSVLQRPPGFLPPVQGVFSLCSFALSWFPEIPNGDVSQWRCLVWLGSVRIGSDRIGSDRLDSVRCGGYSIILCGGALWAFLKAIYQLK